jgi:hypothetical protein
MLVKALLCVVEETATPAENAGRIKAEERIVTSITEVMTRIDAGKGSTEKETLQKGRKVGFNRVPTSA